MRILVDRVIYWGLRYISSRHAVPDRGIPGPAPRSGWKRLTASASSTPLSCSPKANPGCLLAP